MLVIDGARGEGGGQVLRTALALSTCLSKPFRIAHIRANRRRPGLQPQHLAAVRAAAAISRAEVQGAEKNSQALTFEPESVSPGRYHFDIGTAGSTSLVLQTVLPALMSARERSDLVLEGGTHNPLAPPFEFLQYAFLPLLRGMGASVTATLERLGFAPQGGGRVRLIIDPTGALRPIELLERGTVISRRAEVVVANLPEHVALRELAVIRSDLSLQEQELRYRRETDLRGVGNLVCIVVQSSNVSECFTAFGRRGLPAERVAEQAVMEARQYLEANVPVGRHLADQIVPYIALAGRGGFVTMQPSSHTLTNIEVVAAFMGFSLAVKQLAADHWRIFCSG